MFYLGNDNKIINGDITLILEVWLMSLIIKWIHLAGFAEGVWLEIRYPQVRTKSGLYFNTTQKWDDVAF